MTKIQSEIRTKMHLNRLAMAAGLGHFFPREWPVKRCAICGKMCRPGTRDYVSFITQVRHDNDCPLYSICSDHGGENGRDFAEALTGMNVHVYPSPYFLKKALSDWVMEGVYWFGVLLKYAWYTVQPIWHAVRYPYKFAKYLRRKSEIDRFVGEDWLGRKMR